MPMNITEGRKVQYIITGLCERMLKVRIFLDGRVIPRKVVPSLIDVYHPEKNGIRYARGYIYDWQTFCGTYAIVGVRKRPGFWKWAWILDDDGKTKD